MEKKELQKFIKENKQKLPVSFNEIIFREANELPAYNKSVQSKKYNDSDYAIYRFYKSISRF